MSLVDKTFISLNVFSREVGEIEIRYIIIHQTQLIE